MIKNSRALGSKVQARAKFMLAIKQIWWVGTKGVLLYKNSPSGDTPKSCSSLRFSDSEQPCVNGLL